MKSAIKILMFLICLSTVRVSQAEEQVILVIGDSLSAGFNMELDQSWPRLLQKRLRDNGHQYRVFNSSISGDTTQGGLARLPRLLKNLSPGFVIIELGGNDGLRGIGIDITRQNFSHMIEASQASGATVLLTGIRLPPNYGQVYTERFHAMYGELAESYGLLLVPFLMEGVALEPGLMQDDGIHPNEAAQPLLLDNVWTVLGPALD
jgi:acyl-CoA thioesterase-1